MDHGAERDARLIEQIANVIVEHQRIPTFKGYGQNHCSGCDHLYGQSDGPNSPRHAEHVAEQIVARAPSARYAGGRPMSGLDIEGVLCGCGRELRGGHHPHCPAIAEEWGPVQERLVQALADAWDEGYRGGAADAMTSMDARAEFGRAPFANPYRAARLAPSRVPSEET